MSYRYYVRWFEFEKAFTKRTTDITTNGKIVEVLGHSVNVVTGDTTVLALVEVEE